MAITRERLHALRDALPPDRLTDAATALVPLVDPLVAALLNVPDDDEPLSVADRAAIAEGKADAERGDVVLWDQYDTGRLI